MQAAHEANEVEVATVELGRGLDLERDVACHALLGGALARGRNRRVVIIQADEARLGERLRHQDGGGSVSAGDVGDPGAALHALDDAVKCRQPLAHQMRAVAGAEEALGAAEHAMVVRVPAQAFAGAEGFDDLVFIEPERGRDLEGRRHENGALVKRQDHRLRRRQGVSLLLGIVGDIAASRLVGEPLSDIALANAVCFGERRRRTGAEIGQCLIQAELATHIDQHAGRCGAQVGNDLADEGFDLARRGR